MALWILLLRFSTFAFKGWKGGKVILSDHDAADFANGIADLVILNYIILLTTLFY